MRIVQNYRDLQRAKRLSTYNRLSIKNVLNYGSPSSQGENTPYTPPPAPPTPSNEIYTIAGSPLRTIAGAFLTTIS